LGIHVLKARDDEADGARPQGLPSVSNTPPSGVEPASATVPPLPAPPAAEPPELEVPPVDAVPPLELPPVARLPPLDAAAPPVVAPAVPPVLAVPPVDAAGAGALLSLLEQPMAAPQLRTRQALEKKTRGSIGLITSVRASRAPLGPAPPYMRERGECFVKSFHAG
jgi:hypothetical protein